MSVLWLLLSGALAEPPSSTGLDEVISIDATQRVEIRFPVENCERFKATFRDPRDPDEKTTADLRIVLENQTSDTCWFKGVALTGTLEGTYTPTPLPPKGLGIMLEAGKELILDLHPKTGAMVRPLVELFIPPGQGIILLNADPVEPPAPTE